MARRARLRITGLAELKRAMKTYGDALVEASFNAVSSAVTDVITDAKGAAPAITGRLRDNIVGELKTDGHTVIGVVRAKTPYAHLVEYGTERITAKPFLVPAAIRHRRRMNDALAAAVRTHAPEALGAPRVSGEGPAVPGVTMYASTTDRRRFKRRT